MPSPAAATTSRIVVELDLKDYSDTLRGLQAQLGVEAAARLNEQIQEFVDAGLAAVEANREQVVLETTGDGAILAFRNPDEAHRFAVAVHKATEAHNKNLGVPSAERWFRIGIATGDLYEQRRPDGKLEFAGEAIVNAKRLEAAARPGQVIADAATFESLEVGLQALYKREEIVPGKHEERFRAHRCTVVSYDPIRRRWRVPILIGTALMIVAILIWIVIRTPPPEPYVSISNLGEEVADAVTVSGKARDVRPDHRIWLVVKSLDGKSRLYPQSDPVELSNPDGGGWQLWQYDYTCIGATPDGGQEFEIEAVLANQDAQDQLKRDAGENPCESPIFRLPDGVKPYARQKVTRKLSP